MAFRAAAWMLHFSISAMKSRTLPPCLHSLKQFQMFLLSAHPELGRVAALVDGARAIEAVRAAFELVEQAIMLKHLLHGDGRFDGLEVNERCFWHNNTPVFVVVMNVTAREVGLSPRATLTPGGKNQETCGLARIRQVHKGGHGGGFAALPDGGEQIFLQYRFVGEKKQPVAALQSRAGVQQ